MNILFCGGGTCGHISPAIAIADAMRKKYSNPQIAFIGRKDGKENELTKSAGYKTFEICVSGLKRSISLENIKVLKNLLISIQEVKEIFKKFNPDIVIGTGGYVSLPALYQASKSGITRVIHESNAVLGLSARLVANKCNLLLLGANINTKYKNAYYTGNPVREEFYAIKKNDAKKILKIPSDKKLILSVGGSIGAEKFNNSIIELMKNYCIFHKNIYHFHATGHRFFEQCKKQFSDFSNIAPNCKILPFFDDMPTMLNAADLVISRAGAMTLSEISAASVPSILIPSPNVTNNHQLKNALYYEKNGASVLIEEKNLSYSILKDTLNTLISDDGTLKKMSIKSNELHPMDSTQQILNLIEKQLLTR